jgi:hypothetical protein
MPVAVAAYLVRRAGRVFLAFGLSCFPLV